MTDGTNDCVKPDCCGKPQDCDKPEAVAEAVVEVTPEVVADTKTAEVKADSCCGGNSCSNE